MVQNSKTLYDAVFLIDGVTIDWNTEVEITISHDADTVQTDSGNITTNNRNPGAQFSITRHTRFESEKENQIIETIKQLSYKNGGVVTFMVNEPNGTFVVNGYGTIPDERSWNHSTGELMENSIDLVSESYEEYFL